MAKFFKDLTGQKFGRLTAIEVNGTSKHGNLWKCICDCGNETTARSSDLTSQHKRSCGCLGKEQKIINGKKGAGKSAKDVSGKKFGKLTAIKSVGTYKHGRLWKCVCECGNEKIAPVYKLLQGRIKSCGCLLQQNLVGIKFGKLTAIKRAENVGIQSNQTTWYCKCDCGGEIITRTNCLIRGHTKTCGKCERIRHGLCKKGNPRSLYTEYLMKKPENKIKRTVSALIYTTLRKRHSWKNMATFKCLSFTPEEFKIHFESQFEDWMNWDNFGGRSDDNRRTWWIDHIIPQSSFNFTSMNDPQFLECWALSNLRPLEKIENIKKGAKLC